MLRPGMIIQRPDGEIILLRGQNGCDRATWWGYPMVNGKFRKDHIRTIRESGVCAVKKDCGDQYAMG